MCMFKKTAKVNFFENFEILLKDSGLTKSAFAKKAKLDPRIIRDYSK